MKHKSAITGFALFFGLICASFFGNIIGIIIAISSVIISLVLFIFKGKGIGIFLLVIGIGFLYYNAYDYFFIDSLDKYIGTEETITALIKEKLHESNDTAKYLLETKLDGKKVRLIMYAEDSYAVSGNKITVDVIFTKFSKTANFDSERYHFSDGVFLEGIPKSDFIIHDSYEKTLKTEISKIRNYFIININDKLKGDTGALITALFFGEKKYLSDELHNNIKYAGISHFIAVSGFHLTLILHFIVLLLDVSPLRNRRKSRFLIITFIIIAFMFLFNMSSSVIRSGLMLILFYSAELFGRKTSTMDSVGVALIFILLAAPYAALDIGLILSVAGTIGIGTVAPFINKKFNQKWKKNRFRELIISNICAYYLTIPFSVVIFGGFSLTSPVIGIIIQPAITIILVLLLIYFFSGGLLVFPLFAAGILTLPVINFSNFVGGLKYSYITLDYDFIGIWLILSVILVSLTFLITRSGNETIKTAIITIPTLILMTFLYESISHDDYVLDIYSEGKSAYVMLSHKNDKAAVILSGNERIYRKLSEKTYGEVSVLYEIATDNSVLCATDFITAEALMKNETVKIGEILLDTSTENVFISIDEINIIIAKRDEIEVSEKNKNTEIKIIYDYKLKEREMLLGKVYYTNSRQKIFFQNETNAYFEKVRFKVK